MTPFLNKSGQVGSIVLTTQWQNNPSEFWQQGRTMFVSNHTICTTWVLPNRCGETIQVEHNKEKEPTIRLRTILIVCWPWQSLAISKLNLCEYATAIRTTRIIIFTYLLLAFDSRHCFHRLTKFLIICVYLFTYTRYKHNENRDTGFHIGPTVDINNDK